MAKEFFQVQEQQGATIVELSLPDSIDVMAFDELNDTVLQLVEGKSGGMWIIDLTDVQYMGSAMLGLIVNIRQRIKSGGGRLALCNLSSKLAEIIRACCMEQLFTIAKTRADALKAVR
jgi:anti-anti-sigma factor